MSSRSENREVVLVAKQAVCDSTHVQQILVIGADAAQDSEDTLHKKWWFHDAAFCEVREIVEMTYVVAFEFKTRPDSIQLAHGAFNLLKRIRQNEILGGLKIRTLPAVAPLGSLRCRSRNVEIEGAHVHRCNFGLDHQRGRESLIQRHTEAAPSRDVQNRIRLTFDLWQELHEARWSLIGLSRLRVARVQMNNCRSSLGRSHRMGWR